jgi:hypothetical protein
VTWFEFFDDLLVRLGHPGSNANLVALVAWARHENVDASAYRFNPLATTRREGDSLPVPGNTAGVQHFRSFKEGVEATVRTLSQDNMRGIRDALEADVTVRAKLQAVRASPWSNYATLATWSDSGLASMEDRARDQFAALLRRSVA